MDELLRAEGQRVQPQAVQRPMRQMGIAALGPKPRTTTRRAGAQDLPHSLRNLVIERPNHVWAADITYVPIGGDFCHGGDHRLGEPCVLAWRLSNTMSSRPGLQAGGGARQFGKPEIFNDRPGRPIHQRGLHRHAGGGRHPHLDGRRGR